MVSILAVFCTFLLVVHAQEYKCSKPIYCGADLLNSKDDGCKCWKEGEEYGYHWNQKANIADDVDCSDDDFYCCGAEECCKNSLYTFKCKDNASGLSRKCKCKMKG